MEKKEGKPSFFQQLLGTLSTRTLQGWYWALYASDVKLAELGLWDAG